MDKIAAMTMSEKAEMLKAQSKYKTLQSEVMTLKAKLAVANSDVAKARLAALEVKNELDITNAKRKAAKSMLDATRQKVAIARKERA